MDLSVDSVLDSVLTESQLGLRFLVWVSNYSTFLYINTVGTVFMLSLALCALSVAGGHVGTKNSRPRNRPTEKPSAVILASSYPDAAA